MQELARNLDIKDVLNFPVEKVPTFFRSTESDKAALQAPINLLKVLGLLKKSTLEPKERNYVLGLYNAFAKIVSSLGEGRELLSNKESVIFEDNPDEVTDKNILKVLLPIDTSFLEKRKIVNNF